MRGEVARSPAGFVHDGLGAQPAEHATSTRSIPLKSSPAAERTGLRRRGAVLRLRATAGCRSTHSGRGLRKARTSGRLSGCESGPSRGEAAARCALAGANSKFTATRRIDSARGEPAAERTGLRRRGAALRPGAAAGCCGSDRSRKFRIHNSRFKIATRAAAC